MRIFFIVDQTLFFLPEWLDGVIKNLNKDNVVIGVTPLKTKGIPTFQNHLIKNIHRLGPVQILKLTTAALKTRLKGKSVTSVAQKHQTKIIKTNNVNDKKYLDQLKKLRPDIIVSSCSQIFKDELLNLPKIACINRHSALLPAYGGVLPVFWAMLKKEKEIGVTIHHMIRQIDKGGPIYQTRFPVTKNDTLYSLYQKAYTKSVGATLEAIKIIKNNHKPKLVKKTKSSYYSFPKNADWDNFFKVGNRFI